IATKDHRQALAGRLRARGVDVTTMREQGRYLALDAAETLSRILIDGWPDAARFTDVVGDAIARPGGHHRQQLRAFGEMVALLAADGKPDAARRLEELWNALGARTPFTLLCAYPMTAFARPAHAGVFEQICAAHGRVVTDADAAQAWRRASTVRVGPGA